MEQNRQFETIPALLAALTFGALGLTAAVVIGSREAPPREATAPPKRSHQPLRWPLAELPPLETPNLGLAESDSLLDPWSLSLSPMSLSFRDAEDDEFAWALTAADATDQLAAQPLTRERAKAARPPAATRPSETPFRGEMVVVPPASPRWRAGDRAPLVVTAKMRRDWSVIGVDTIRLANAAGRMISRPDYRGSTEWASARIREASAWLPPASPKVAAEEAVGPEPLTAAPSRSELLLVAPTTPSRLASNPLRPKPVRKTAAPTVPPTIAAYLAAVSAIDFPTPHALADQLDRVAEDRDLAPWAWAAAYRLRTLASTPASDTTAVTANFEALANAVADAHRQAERMSDGAAATELRRAAYAIDRRVATWRPSQLHTMTLAKRDRLAGVRWAMRGDDLGLALADEPAPMRLAARLEAYESRPSARLARQVVSDAAQLARSDDAQAVALARAVQSNYRNSNVRVAIAGELIERMLPQQAPSTSPVRDRIAGAVVTGTSTTNSTLDVALVPDEAAWRIDFAARGSVLARTSSRGGPARLVSQGATQFTAKKLVVVSRESLDAQPAIAQATSRAPRLVGLSTSYDRVPLLRDYARSTARSEYARMRSRARVETQAKVEHRVRREFDRRIAEQITRLDERYRQTVVARAEQLGLEVEPLEMRTTDTRLISRLRLAGQGQLAAHTPRMRAPSDSLLSVQLHESTLNNALEGLDLAGARLTPEQLRERLSEKLGIEPQEADERIRAVLQFAEVEPARFTLQDGRAELTLSFRELSVARRRHRDFKVHAFYRPVVDGVNAALVQDGTPHIEGRLRTASRMHLHGVLGKVLAKTERLPLVEVGHDTPERIAAALIGLSTNQFVIEDGWLGLAIGPTRPAPRVALQVGGYVR